MARRKQLRQWARLRVLCCSGLSLLSVVPDAFAVVREIVPNAAAALFLTSPEGVPHAFLHEDSPESVQSLFLGEPQLFVGPHEFNVFRLVGAPGAISCPTLAPPGEAYFRSNTYQLLVRGSGHHHTLDARLEVDGRRSGLVSLFREPGRGFDEHDIARVALHFEHALKAANPSDPADELAGPEAMLVCTPQLAASGVKV